MTPKGIMVHSTGANNPTLRRYVGPDDGLLGANQYGNHWNTYRPGGRQVCVHGFIGKLKDNPTTRVLIHEKSSLAPPGQSLAFSLGDEKGFEWIGAYDITADELLAGTDTAKTESKTAQAEMLILELLANGKKMPSAELEKAVNDRGISSRTMRTAKSRIGDRLITEKDGTAWVCYLRN